MNIVSWVLWGFVATLVQSLAAGLFYGLGLTRMSLPLLIGLMYTADRDRALIIGLVKHLLLGWGFSLIYIAVFQQLHQASWWMGAIMGLVQALFVLCVVMPALPAIHPRMAREHHGPTAARALEAPGFMALNYGVQTPLTVVVSHLLYGIVLGALYRPG